MLYFPVEKGILLINFSSVYASQKQTLTDDFVRHCKTLLHKTYHVIVVTCAGYAKLPCRGCVLQHLDETICTVVHLPKLQIVETITLRHTYVKVLSHE